MKLSYPLNLMLQQDGNWLVQFDDIPEALTEGESRQNALSEASDCLIAALGGYIREGRDIPLSSFPKKGREVIVLPVLVCAKIALYRAVRESGISYGELAMKMGVSKREIEKLLDPDERSDIDRIDEALSLLGKEMEIEIRNAA
ncbi:MAG: type II toxin-antitoxin system HicB family antitoxin [Desulfobacterales bacterium]